MDADEIRRVIEEEAKRNRIRISASLVEMMVAIILRLRTA